jgi:hypothetical protein
MEEKIAQKYSVVKGFLDNVKRVAFEVIALVVLLVVFYYAPYDADSKMFLFNVFVTKFFLVSCGILHAHITRKLLFPYIHFSTEKDLTNNIMVIALYITIIFAWARGG